MPRASQIWLSAKWLHQLNVSAQPRKPREPFRPQPATPSRARCRRRSARASPPHPAPCLRHARSQGRRRRRRTPGARVFIVPFVRSSSATQQVCPPLSLPFMLCEFVFASNLISFQHAVLHPLICFDLNVVCYVYKMQLNLNNYHYY